MLIGTFWVEGNCEHAQSELAFSGDEKVYVLWEWTSFRNKLRPNIFTESVLSGFNPRRDFLRPWSCDYEVSAWLVEKNPNWSYQNIRTDKQIFCCDLTKMQIKSSNGNGCCICSSTYILYSIVLARNRFCKFQLVFGTKVSSISFQSVTTFFSWPFLHRFWKNKNIFKKLFFSEDVC